jgi:hypothetical protein
LAFFKPLCQKGVQAFCARCLWLCLIRAQNTSAP